MCVYTTVLLLIISNLNFNEEKKKFFEIQIGKISDFASILN